jgi:ornithine cyclodeaminase/alanine dehydrogenase-like protein (mu-crystallin family)
VGGREGAGEITLFKSVGTAIEDLAAAVLLWEKLAPAEAVDKMGRAVPSNGHG